MYRILKTIGLIMTLLLVMAGCSTASPAEDNSETPNATDSPMNDDVMEEAEEMTFTLEELAQYDGQNGNPAYVAVDGVVYDVTDVPAWSGGKHNGNMAGTDASDAITQAPHGKSTLENLPVVGIITE